VAELELGVASGPDQAVRLIAATQDPATLKPAATWYMATNLPAAEASPAEVYELYCLRDWIEHYYKPAKHELGWADFQMRAEQAIVRHWHLVMLAFTFSLLAGLPPDPTALSVPRAERPGGKIRAPDGLAGYTPPGAALAVPLGARAPVLAELVHRTSTA
jgi:hypothetical protein